MFTAQLRRDLLANWRAPVDIGMGLAFFLLVISLFPLGLGPEPVVLAAAAPGIIWVLALLASLLSVESMYRQDHADGSLEQLVLEAEPLFLAVLAKAVAQWLLTGLPLVIVSPLAALMLALPAQALPALLLSLLLGTPVVTLLAGIGAALTAGLGRGGTLLALIILPLYVPVLIFGVAAGGGGDALAGAREFALLVLCALLALSVTLAPFAIAAAVRVGVEQ